MVNKMKKVLVTDCNSRKALCVVRSLGKQGYKVIAADKDRLNMTRFSKYCSNFFHFPSPLTSEIEYIYRLKSIINEENIDVLIPMEDETVELIVKNINLFENVKTLLPDYETFMIARDKGETLKKAIKYGVSCPTTFFVNDIEELNKIKSELSYPVIIKPRISSGSRGIIHVNNENELIKKYQEIHYNYPNPILQHYLAGNFKKVQVLILMDRNHKVKALCSYEGIREFPVSGGPVTMWKTISNPELEKITIEFLEHLKWVGFAEVEYIVNRDTGQSYLMEINPRFSANIALAVHVGVDFPLLLTKLALNENVKTVVNKKEDQYCQWLIPGDLLNFIFNKNRFNEEVGYLFNKPKNLCHAIYSKDDPLPFIVNFLSLFTGFIKNLKNLKEKLSANA